MGFFRFLLAITVVMFHMGGISWLSGRVAVFGFYSVSGYLIFRVLDRVYLKDMVHLGLFFLNRFLRLMPLYVVIAALTYVFLLLRGGAGFVIDPHDPPYNFISPSILDVKLGQLFINEAHLGWKAIFRPFPTITFSPNLIPQGWSIGVELCFYALAPIAVWLCRKRLVYLLPMVLISLTLFLVGIIASPDYAFVENFVYKNFLASAFMFLLGGGMYFVSQRTTWRLNFKWTLLFLTCWMYYLWYTSSSLVGAQEPSAGILLINIGLIIPIALVVIFSKVPTNWERFDSTIGNLSYGIYLNHFLVGYMILLANEYFLSTYGVHQIMGRLNSHGFGYVAVFLSVSLAILTFRLIEHPIDRVRRRLRG